MEPPSRQFVELLQRLGLATPRDLRRCRPIVRRLARDLPTFDSVWIDALTQTRVLTPLQARLLEADQPEQLAVGPCLLIDEWERDTHWTLYAAKHRDSGRRCLLTYFQVSAEGMPRARENTRGLISTLRGIGQRSIIVPQGCDELHDRLVIVSPHVTGPTLQQLLVRRGRFPIPVVTEIARQLLDALSILEEHDVVHGDLRLASVRLTGRGRAILLNPGVLPVIGSRVSFHDTLPADAYDGIAPELISTGRLASSPSDLYALGCLLFQLLAGRPPFPTGDPLGKLAAHQSKAMDDVRRWRPDAPAELATLLLRLTQKDPDLRPAGASEARRALRLGARGGHSNLSRFHASFGKVAPRHGDSHRSAARFPWTIAATMLFALSGLSLALLDVGARNELLRLASTFAPAASEPVSSSPTPPRIESGPQHRPFPSTPVDGVILVQTDGPFAPVDIHSDRSLRIQAAEGITPTVIIAQHPLRVTCQSLQIEGIRFVTAPPESGGDVSTEHPRPSTLLAVQAQQAAVDHCQFEFAQTDATDHGDSTPLPDADSHSKANSPRTHGNSSIAWKVLDEADPTGGRFVVRHSTFRGSAGAVAVHAMPRLIGFDNCLKQGPGPMLQLLSSSQSAPLRLHLRQSTLRDATALVEWDDRAANGSIQPLLVVVENSVFALQADGAGLLKFSAAAPTGWERLLQITGEGSLLRPGSSIALADDLPMEANTLRVEGVIIDDFEFVSAGDDVAASAVASTQAPRSTSLPPGIDPTRLVGQNGSPVVRQASHE